MTATVPDREAALAAVGVATRQARRVQATVRAAGPTIKADASPVTVADLAIQATVSLMLTRQLGPHHLVAEEDIESLSGLAATPLRREVLELVRSELGAVVTEDEMLAAIARGSDPPPDGSFWTLDPIDGTKGFLRGEQYAIALARIENGRVVLGALACPNLPNSDGSNGATFVAVEGRCEAIASNGSTPVSVAPTGSLASARLVESVEAGHSNHDDTARVAQRLGIVTEPHRLDSQCKYGAVARGEASIYLRLPTRADYREKIWDHAAGAFVVEQSGGRVTDVDGRPLDFTRGRTLAANRGVIATNGEYHDEVVAAVNEVLGR